MKKRSLLAEPKKREGSMKKNKRNTKRILCISVFVFLGIALLLYELWLKRVLFTGLGEWEKGMTDMLITRLIGGGIFLTFTVYLGYRVLNPFTRPVGKNILFILPALVIAVNNLPMIPLFRGLSSITSPAGKILLLLCECMAIGFFEEMAFRSVVMLGIMENKRRGKRDIVFAILISAAVFGLVHIVNVFINPSVMVVLQIFYSAAIGAMCSVVLLLTRNVWACVMLHGLFNFMGALIGECGEGRGFFEDPPTQILTAVIALAVIGIYVWLFVKYDVSEADGFYVKNNENKNSDIKEDINERN